MLILTEGNRSAKEGDRIETGAGQQARRSAFSVATGGNVERSSETAQRCHRAATLGNPAKQCGPQLRERTGQDRDQCRVTSSALGGQRCHGAATLKEFSGQGKATGTRRNETGSLPVSAEKLGAQRSALPRDGNVGRIQRHLKRRRAKRGKGADSRGR